MSLSCWHPVLPSHSLFRTIICRHCWRKRCFHYIHFLKCRKRKNNSLSVWWPGWNGRCHIRLQSTFYGPYPERWTGRLHWIIRLLYHSNRKSGVDSCLPGGRLRIRPRKYQSTYYLYHRSSNNGSRCWGMCRWHDCKSRNSWVMQSVNPDGRYKYRCWCLPTCVRFCPLRWHGCVFHRSCLVRSVWTGSRRQF